MINTSFNYLSGLTPWQMVGVGIVTGLILREIVPRIVNIALKVFKELSDTFRSVARVIANSTTIVNIHSVFCEECANEHRDHMT